MLLFVKIIFWISIVCLLHSYIFYPILMKIGAMNKSNNTIIHEKDGDFPRVSLLMAVYNEESIIREKMNSLLEIDYPIDRYEIFIGSDNSSDKTNDIIQEFCKTNRNIHFYPFTKRTGKPGIINQLVQYCTSSFPIGKDHIFLMTDASVILQKETIKKLCRHYKNDKIGIVDANMLHTGMQGEGISKSENQYIHQEVLLKHSEGKRWGTMIGPFGGCYALRSDYFQEVPPTFLVDDFYIAMRVLEKGAWVINDLEAVCYESVSHDIKEEYRRKARISAGNFQNLVTFKHLLNPFSKLGYSFISHKVIRWIGPILILLILISSTILAYYGNLFFVILLILQILWLLFVPLMDYVLNKLNFHVFALRSIAYFNIMNVALLQGFIRFINGIKNNVWEPPKRN